MVRTARSYPDLKVCAIVGVALILFAEANAGSPEPGPSHGSPRAGHSQAIAVKDGKASFGIPNIRHDSRSLVIVSALARPRGPYPIRLQVRPADETKPFPPQTQVQVARTLLEPLQPLDIPPVTSRPPLDRRTFHLMAQGGNVSAASSYQAVEGHLKAVGHRIQVYVDQRDTTSVDDATIQDLISTFDNHVYPQAARRFGPASDVDRDGRFTVLFSSSLGRLAGGKVSVDGFVRGADLDLDLAQPFGNRCDMMYLNTSLKAGPHLRTIVAHEYTHAVTFSRKALARGSSGSEEEGWLDEALAHLVEDAHGFSLSNIDYRVSAFLSSPESYRLVVDDYYAANLFRSHGNRGATYLFLRWCVDRYGPGLIDLLIRSELRGVANLEAATGARFEDLFRRWTVALFCSGLDPRFAAEEGYRTIDLRGELEDWVLAGPMVTAVGPSNPENSWVAEGTTTHYVIVEGFPGSKSVVVDVVGPPAAEVQVTTVPLPDRLGWPRLLVRGHESRDGQVEFEAEVTEQSGTAVRLGALVWEPLVPADDSRKPGCRRGGLDMLGIANAFGTSALPARGKLQSRPIRLTGSRGWEGPIVFKAVGTDALGRRVAAWSIANLTGKPQAVTIEKIGPL